MKKKFDKTIIVYILPVYLFFNLLNMPINTGDGYEVVWDEIFKVPTTKSTEQRTKGRVDEIIFHHEDVNVISG